MCVVRCAWYSATRDELRSRRAEHVTIPRTTYQRTILSGAPDSLRFGGCWPGAPILSSASRRGCSSAGRAPGSHPGGQGFEPPQLHSHLTYGRLMRATPSLHATQSTQTEVYARWARDPEGFWAEAGEAIHWSRRWDRVLDSARAPFYRWFPGATVNTCENALDWHVEHGRADQPALIYDSPVTGTIKTFTYRELRDAVARFAGVLLGQGVGRGDRVIIYMPMVPEAAIAMLACARIGAIHSVVFGGFASHELAARISHAAPVVIVSASCGIEVNRVVPYKPLLDKAIELAEVKPRRCIILQRPQEQAPLIPARDLDWG